MDRTAAASGAYICFRSDLVELRPCCTLRGRLARQLLLLLLLINVKKILAVINATYAVAKRKPEKIRLAGIRTLTSAIPVQRSNQLS